jgi:hypothetical protein
MRLLQCLLAVMLACVGALAQQPQPPALTLTPVLAPGMTIGGHSFTQDTAVGSAVINDGGEVAFIARWTENQRERGGVFTLHRIVAMEGDVLDGEGITLIDVGAPLAINAGGQVGFAAFFTHGDINEGVFVERHTAFDFRRTEYRNGTPITLTDDGRVTVGGIPVHASCAPATTTQSKMQSVLGRIGVNPIHRGPVTITPTPAQGPSIQPGITAAAPVCLGYPFTLLPSNAKGQVVIPVNTSAGAFLFIGTPIAH